MIPVLIVHTNNQVIFQDIAKIPVRAQTAFTTRLKGVANEVCDILLVNSGEIAGAISVVSGFQASSTHTTHQAIFWGTAISLEIAKFQ